MKLPPLKRDLAAIEGTEFDLCVVGGGVTGLCVAHDAAARGLKVALLERGDFAEGTTTASTKLIHGGTRYLEHLEVGLVREALHERRLLLKLAPHLVHPVPFMIPIYRGGLVPPWKIRAGMLLYDLLSFDKNWGQLPDKHMPWHRFVSSSEALALEPELPSEGLKGASVYYDGQVPSPARLCIEVAKTACRNGAQLANYARVAALRVDAGRVTGVEALDRHTGKTIVVRAQVTVNAAGIWATDVMKLLGPAPPVQLKPSKGIHLITRALTRSHAVVNGTPSGRRVMIIPWRGKSLIGTTDVFYEGDKDRIRPTAAESQGLLDEVNAFLPSAKLSLDDVDHGFAGARPLIYKAGKSASALSREYKIIDHGRAANLPGLLSIVGGKLTTSRHLAMVVMNRVEKEIGRRRPCPTAGTFIGGGDVGVVNEYVEGLRGLASGKVDDACLRELVSSYGSGCADVLARVEREPRLGGRIVPELPYVLAEVGHAVEHEMASSVSDIAIRRTDIAGLGDRSGRAGKVIALELQRLLGFSDAERERQVRAYLDDTCIDGCAAPETGDAALEARGR